MVELEILKKEEISHERDEEGNLLPQQIEVEELRQYEERETNGKKEKVIVKRKGIVVVPLSRTQLRKYFANAKKSRNGNIETDKDIDAKLLMEHCIEPKLEEKDLKALKGTEITAMIIALISFSSGMSQEELTGLTKQAMQKKVKEMSDETKKS